MNGKRRAPHLIQKQQVLHAYIAEISIHVGIQLTLNIPVIEISPIHTIQIRKMREHKLKPEVNKCIFNLIHAFLGILPSTGLKRHHLLHNVKMTQVLHVYTNLRSGISGVQKQVIQLILPSGNGGKNGVIHRQFPQLRCNQLLSCIEQRTVFIQHQTTDILFE